MTHHIGVCSDSESSKKSGGSTDDKGDAVLSDGDFVRRSGVPLATIPVPGLDRGTRFETHLIQVVRGMLGLVPVGGEVRVCEVLVVSRQVLHFKLGEHGAEVGGELLEASARCARFGETLFFGECRLRKPVELYELLAAS